LGVWLPVALADLMRIMIVLVRRVAGDTGEISLLKRSKILAMWMLPAMAAAVDEDEQEAEAFAMLESVRNLKRKNEQKHTPV
jgi:hypothetical protein